ncbi:UDP-glucose 4-epimerase GalE [Thalassovita mediterranea]|jgi:UDP-arabinose 4-epimerase|uniref:UDP-glucose 4-epimerase n=1 Tax=Thalassovita mediterranea TaxID=340021 RepID=A0A0N7M1G9_9RHOB|nr:UDP-glucose 4-epimerase GalE [Thalassovita mediterranea]CUH83275.1 UDP-glucose 4-epimerase [Thalassovita mediterranea]SIS33809.1 UDP-arabinose 4-epimerase [Thalassovita mediterranea]
MSASVILVTGGAGFIGSHVCKQLAREGFQPLVIDDLSTGHEEAVRWGPLVQIDVRDTDRVTEVLQQFQIETVMHFAASAYVGESVMQPLRYYDNNVGGMISLMKACQQADVSRVIFSSSCATYGAPSHQPIGEETLQTPTNPYGRTKLACEQILRDVGRANGMRHAILRYFNAAGCDPEGELCERHDPETHIIPLALMTAAGQRQQFSVFGRDYATPDGTCVRDYIHVTDLAVGHVAALKHLLSGGESLSVNLGTGHGHSVLEIINKIEQMATCKMPVVFEDRRAGDPPILVADPDRARDLLGFQARHSQLETILRDAAPSFGVHVS